MGSSNLPLIMWYAVCGVVGAIIHKKNRFVGFLIGLGAALILITLFALLMSP